MNFPLQDSSELKGISSFLDLADNLGIIHRNISEGPIGVLKSIAMVH